MKPLIRSLSRFPNVTNLRTIVPTAVISPGQGFKEANKSILADWLKNYRELPAESLTRYGPYDKRCVRDVPDMVERRGVEDVYHGHRLLVGRGIKTGGLITARLETHKYAFRNSIHGVRLKGLEPWQEATIIGIFWSSLARYFYFTTSGSWGFWHDELHLEDVEAMPICFPKDINLRNRIVRVVAELQQLDMQSANFGLFRHATTTDPRRLEEELDAAIFDLYELTVAERDLIHEKCSIGLDLFYQHHNGEALREVIRPTRNFGTLSDVSQAKDGLTAYLRTFLEAWNPELAPDGELDWRVLSPPSHAPLLAVCFATRYKREKPLATCQTTTFRRGPASWRSLQHDSLVHGGSSRIFIDTFFRHVSDRDIVFIKRNERRFWTRSAAREDAESTLTHLMNLEDVVSGDRR